MPLIFIKSEDYAKALDLLLHFSSLKQICQHHFIRLLIKILHEYGSIHVYVPNIYNVRFESPYVNARDSS